MRLCHDVAQMHRLLLATRRARRTISPHHSDSPVTAMTGNDLVEVRANPFPSGMSSVTHSSDSSESTKSPDLKLSRPFEEVHHTGNRSPRLALHQMTTYRWDLTREIREIRSAGCQAIGLWRNKLDDDELTAAELEEDGLAVSSLSWSGFFTGSHGMTFDEAVADAREAVSQARTLGAETLVIYSGARAGHTLTHARRLTAWGLRAVADFAAEQGVQLALCPLSALGRRWSFLHGLDPALEVLDIVRHPNVGLACDLYHLWLSESRMELRIDEIASRTRLVHVSDGPATPSHEYDQSLPGKGRVPVNEWVRRFSAAGYQGYYEVQCWSESVWRTMSGAQLGWLMHDLRSAALAPAEQAARTSLH